MVDVGKVARRIMAEEDGTGDDHDEIVRIATLARTGRLAESFAPQERITEARANTDVASGADRAEARKAVLMLLGRVPTPGSYGHEVTDPTGMKHYRQARRE